MELTIEQIDLIEKNESLQTEYLKSLCDLARSGISLAEKNKELREALAWYGEQARLCRLIHTEGDAGRTALSTDGGALSKKVLES